MRRRLVVGAAFLSTLALPVEEARAQFAVECVNCNNEWTQVLMLSKQVLQYEKEVETALHAFQLAQQAAKDAVNLATHPVTDISADLSRLESVLQGVQGIAGSMAQVDAMFRNIYQPSLPMQMQNFSQAYDTWSSTTLRTILGSVNAAAHHGQMIQNEQALIQRIRALNQSPQGRTEAVQLGNVIGQAELSSLAALRDLMRTDMIAKDTFMGHQMSLQAAQQAETRNAFGHADPIVVERPTANREAWQQ